MVAGRGARAPLIVGGLHLGGRRGGPRARWCVKRWGVGIQRSIRQRELGGRCAAGGPRSCIPRGCEWRAGAGPAGRHWRRIYEAGEGCIAGACRPRAMGHAAWGGGRQRALKGAAAANCVPGAGACRGASPSSAPRLPPCPGRRGDMLPAAHPGYDAQGRQAADRCQLAAAGLCAARRAPVGLQALCGTRRGQRAGLTRAGPTSPPRPARSCRRS
jgi:hypothetical protein